jgi:hypothetical protein
VTVCLMTSPIKDHHWSWWINTSSYLKPGAAWRLGHLVHQNSWFSPGASPA